MQRDTTKRKFSILSLALIAAVFLSACLNGSSDLQPPPASSGGNRTSQFSAPSNTTIPSSGGGESTEQSLSETSTPEEQPRESEDVKIKITVGEQELTATLLDNATANALLDKLPLTVLMEDLYSREMCFRFPDALPAHEAETTGYEVGELIYWPPGHSLVIMYAQNGERFNMQKIGRIDSGVALFEETGDTQVTFERLNA